MRDADSLGDAVVGVGGRGGELALVYVLLRRGLALRSDRLQHAALDDERDHAHHRTEHGPLEPSSDTTPPGHGACTSDSGAKTRYTSTLSLRPLTSRAPMASTVIPGAAATVAAVATISPASASDWRRWAIFTASPTTVYSRRPPPPTVPAMTVPVLTPIPIPSAWSPPAQPSQFSSVCRACMARAQRSARSASSACCSGTPNTAMTASPANLSIVP